MGERIKQKTTEDDSCLVLGICNYSCTELYMLANWTPILIDFVSVCVRMEGYKVAYPSRYAYLMPMTPELLSCIKLDESVPGKADYRKGDASYTGLLINKNVLPFANGCSRIFSMCLLLVVRDDPDAVEILHSDLQRLAPLEFLNDTLIDFYIKYDSLSPTSLLQKSSLQGQINKFSSADEGIDCIKFGIYPALIGGCWSVTVAWANTSNFVHQYLV